MISNPTSQRQLRGHHPQRSIPRSASSSEHLAFLARRLTARDRWLIRVLHERMDTGRQLDV